MGQEDVTGTETEIKTGETLTGTPPAEETKTGDETPSEDIEAKPKETETPEEVEKKKQHNRDQFERRRLRKLELENAELRGRTQVLEEIARGKKPKEEEAADKFVFHEPEPEQHQFESTTEWMKEWNRWDRKREAAESQHVEAKKTKSAVSEERQKVINASNQRADSFAEEHEDFLDAVDAVKTKIRGEKLEDLADMAVDSEFGPDIYYHLGKNPKELERFANLSKWALAKEFGRLEDKLRAASQTKKDTPPPPPSLDGKGNATQKDYFDEKLSTEERIAISRKRKLAAQGR